ncbi:hypothetical protein LCGC14_2963370, partial [marine sediment metagenome]
VKRDVLKIRARIILSINSFPTEDLMRQQQFIQYNNNFFNSILIYLFCNYYSINLAEFLFFGD